MPDVNPYLPPSLQAKAPRRAGVLIPGLPVGAVALRSRTQRGPLGQTVGMVAGVVAAAGFTAALVVLLRMMLEVTSQGGFCARGGPYVIAHECSSQVALFTPLSILSLFVFAGIGIAARGVGMLVVALAWPALFCTLGGGFLRSAGYPQFGATGYILGGMFILMGAVPLLLMVSAGLSRLRKGRDGDDDGVPAAAQIVTNLVRLAAGIAIGWYAALRLLAAT